MRNNPPDWANQTIDLAIMFSGGVFPYANYRIACKDFRPEKLIFDSGLFFQLPFKSPILFKHILPPVYRRAFPITLANIAINSFWLGQHYNWRVKLREFE